MKKAIFCLLAYLFITGTNYCQSDSEWNLKKDKNNIKIYECHQDDSSVVEFKIVTAIKAPLSRIARMLRDVESYVEWSPNLETVKLLKELNENDKVYYVELNAPWPISNRDNIIHFQLQDDSVNAFVKISYTGLPDYIPENDGLVRIPNSKGRWQLSATTKGETNVFAMYSSDLSGTLPNWIYRFFAVEGVYKMIYSLKTHAEAAGQGIGH